MPLALGNKKIKRMYLGTKEVKKAYLGTKQVYPEQTENSVYILHVNGNLYKREEWNTSDNTHAVGVAVITDKCKFVIAPDIVYELIYSDKEGIIPNVTTTTIPTDAQTDYNGVNNTSAIFNYVDNPDNCAASYCNTLSLKDGRMCHLGAAGEWNEAFKNKEEVDACMALIGGLDIYQGYDLWTSTQADDTDAWVTSWQNGGVYINRKENRDCVRPFARL